MATFSCWEDRVSVVDVVWVRGVEGGVGHLLGLVTVSQLLALEDVGVCFRGVAGVAQVRGPSLLPSMVLDVELGDVHPATSLSLVLLVLASSADLAGRPCGIVVVFLPLVLFEAG